MLKLVVWGKNALYSLRSDRKGVTALEYSVIAAVTVVTIAALLIPVSSALTVEWGKIVGALS